ncbi:rCG61908, isoform CRA_b [Rattus norvegicus]|uniref:RCG61908, isoform CRA_b n=1 Tax=Rattus norvegicus TaxID=10116 RepID=A6HCI1_RAT|nr:rCG61908, isoform CRA_b [Rattus norvegicus]
MSWKRSPSRQTDAVCQALARASCRMKFDQPVSWSSSCCHASHHHGLSFCNHTPK